MVTVADRVRRVQESRGKICSPFQLDETLCLYSPQDNLDALAHPRIARWIEFVTRHYQPDLPACRHAVLLMMPCTKTKPYPFSLEHKRINQALLDAGFRPVGQVAPPAELAAALEPEFSPDVLNLAPLMNDRGVLIDRAIISEPLAFVPYRHAYTFEDGYSPATAYDDPGLFEQRGNAASPWRADNTAFADSSGRWHWGEQEKRAYVEMHNIMARTLADVIGHLTGRYDRFVAWVAPGLTHRSFILERQARRTHGVPTYRAAGKARLPLVGANDVLAEDNRIVCLPTPEQCRLAITQLAKRLGRPESKVGGYYSRGGGGATPLALAELLDFLVQDLEAAP